MPENNKGVIRTMHDRLKKSAARRQVFAREFNDATGAMILANARLCPAGLRNLEREGTLLPSVVASLVRDRCQARRKIRRMVSHVPTGAPVGRVPSSQVRVARKLVRMHFPDVEGRPRLRRIDRWSQVLHSRPGRRLYRPTTELERMILRYGAFDPANRYSTEYLSEGS
ncbi:hypothetical protein [Streptomyces sp. NPDC001089]